MAFYTDLGDGSFQVETDDGRTLRTALDPSALMAMGVTEKPAAVQQFDEANTVAQNSVLTGGSPYRPIDANPVADSIGKPGVQLVDKAPPKTIPITAGVQPQREQQQGNARLDALSDLAASNLVRRTAARSPGGKIPVSETVQRAPVASPQDLDALAEQELGTEAQVIGQQQQIFDERNALLDKSIAENAKRETELARQVEARKARDAKILELQTFAEQKEREVAEMQTLSPTDEYFKNAGGPWAKVVAGISVLLGGLGQAFSAAGGMNTQNQGMQAIQAGIKERAEMLKQQHEQAQAAGRTARNAYTDYLQIYGTPEFAMQALNDRGEAIADQKLALMAQKTGNQETMNQVLMWQAQRSEARALRTAERNAAAAGAISKSYKFDQGSGGGATLDPKMMQYMLDVEKLRGESSGKTGETLVRLPDGSTGNAPSSGQAKEYQATIQSSNAVAEAAARIRHLKAQPGAKTDPSKRAQLQTAARQLQLALKKKEVLGTLDKGSVEFLNDLTGDPSGLVDFGGADARLQEIESSARKEIEDTKRFGLGINTQQPTGVQSDE